MKSKKERKIHNKIEIFLICLFFVVALLFTYVVSAHQFSSHEIRVKAFFAEEKDIIDVVHIGASEIYTGFSPEYIWHNYGITNYNLATAGAPIRLVKNQIKAAIKEQNPKLIVISLNGTLYDDKRAQHDGYMRMWLDNMKDNTLRNEAIGEWVKPKERKHFKIKLLNYHDNIARTPECVALSWREFKMKNDKRLLTISGIQGQAVRDEKRDVIDVANYDKAAPLADITGKEFTELLEYLKEENIGNVIFVNMPRFYEQKNINLRAKLNTAMMEVKKYGFDVYDLDKEIKAIGLDQQNDYYNTSHPNIYGQQKISKYFYENIIPKYVSEHRKYSDDVIKRLDENYDAYTKVYAWIDKMIKKTPVGEHGIHYTYKAVDHVLGGTIDKYEKTLEMKAKIFKKSQQDNRDEGKSKGKIKRGETDV